MLSNLLLVAVGAAAQSSTSRNPADGLSTPAGSSQMPTISPSVVTVVNDNITQTYRNIATLPASIDETPPILPNIQDPQAIDAQESCPGYRASNVTYTDYGFNALLSLAGKACNAYGFDVQALNLSVEYQSGDRLSVRVVPSNISASEYQRYIIPAQYVAQPSVDDDAEHTVPDNDLQFTWSNEPSFGFSVVRKSTSDVLFNTTGSKLVFEDQFVEFVSELPEDYNLFGLGEHIRSFRLGNNYTATIYAADVGDTIDANLYGSHPFYLDTRYYSIDNSTGERTLVNSSADPSGDYESYSHGVYLRNAHGQEILLRPENITWRTLGGSIDLYFFAGPNQVEVTKQYVNQIGLPAMMPYWSFGYHQCRWGYENVSRMQEIVGNFRDFDIPLEVIWNDIDYMYAYRDFENDPNRFDYGEMGSFLDTLHANGQHYIPIVDSAIYIPNPKNQSDAYGTYARGHANNSFMLTAEGDNEYIGSVWPGYTVFPDWRSAGAQSWWNNEMLTWYQKNMTFDGIWIDMSEASSFCVGPCGIGRLTENQVHPPFALPGEPGNKIYGYPEGFNITNATEAAAASSASSSQAAAASTSAAGSSTSTSYLRTTPTAGVRSENFPPYAINNANGALPVHAVAPNATHHDNAIEYDIHNLFGYEILNATYHALLGVFPGKRPFIIGRSTFVGAGSVAGHWGGDNTSLFAYMYLSISQALDFALFGIPMFGVDTCGFNGQSDEELCNRWMQLSAFFPFYRNHNTLSANSQEPYVWASVAEATKKAINIRYSLLPYIYTIFNEAHETGSTVMRALAWEFPSEPALAGVDNQFLLGPSILVTPVLEPNVATVKGVFPGAGKGATVWYDWYTQEAVDAQPGENKTIDAPLGHIPVYVRGGSVLPMQEPGYTTAESRQNPWALLVALDKSGDATGSLYLDDGVSLVQNATKYVDFTVANNALYASGRGCYNDTNALANVTILGVPQQPSSVSLNGQMLSNVAYNSTSQVVYITGLQNMTSAGAWQADWSLKWSFGGSGNGTYGSGGYGNGSHASFSPRN